MPIIRVANGKTVAASGVGSIVLRLRNQHGKYERLILDDVAFIPEMSQSLLSPKRLWKTHRIKTKFGDACEFKALNGSRFTFPRNDDDYLIQTEVAAYAHECVFSASPTTEPASSLLHRRLAHFGHARLRAAGLRSVGLPSLKNYLDHPFCDSCAKGSHVHVPFTKKKPRKYSYFGQLIHSDVCSGFPPSVVHGYEYMVNFVDAATGFVAIYFTKDKTADSIIECVKQFSRTRRLLTQPPLGYQTSPGRMGRSVGGSHSSLITNVLIQGGDVHNFHQRSFEVGAKDQFESTTSLSSKPLGDAYQPSRDIKP